jgi:hypothetical protein
MAIFKPKSWPTTKVLTWIRKFTPPCKEITRLLSQSIDRRLPIYRRLGVWLHFAVCDLCRRRQAPRVHPPSQPLDAGALGGNVAGKSSHGRKETHQARVQRHPALNLCANAFAAAPAKHESQFGGFSGDGPRSARSRPIGPKYTFEYLVLWYQAIVDSF